MTIKNSFAKFAGNSSRFVLEKFFKRGSTLPGKIALKFDPEILKSLTKNYEIIVVTGTNGKTLTTALTVGILEKAFGPVVTNPTGANMITGIVSTFLKAPKAKTAKRNLLSLRLMKRVCQKSLNTSNLHYLFSQIFSVTKWTAMERFTPPTISSSKVRQIALKVLFY